MQGGPTRIAGFPVPTACVDHEGGRNAENVRHHGELGGTGLHIKQEIKTIVLGWFLGAHGLGHPDCDRSYHQKPEGLPKGKVPPWSSRPRGPVRGCEQRAFHGLTRY